MDPGKFLLYIFLLISHKYKYDTVTLGQSIYRLYTHKITKAAYTHKCIHAGITLPVCFPAHLTYLLVPPPQGLPANHGILPTGIDTFVPTTYVYEIVVKIKREFSQFSKNPKYRFK